MILISGFAANPGYDMIGTFFYQTLCVRERNRHILLIGDYGNRVTAEHIHSNVAW